MGNLRSDIEAEAESGPEIHQVIYGEEHPVCGNSTCKGPEVRKVCSTGMKVGGGDGRVVSDRAGYQGRPGNRFQHQTCTQFCLRKQDH